MKKNSVFAIVIFLALSVSGLGLADCYSSVLQVPGNAISADYLVNGYYQLILRRAPDQAGFDYYYGNLMSGAMKPYQVAYSMAVSPEASATYGPLWAYYWAHLNDDPDAVYDLYSQLLNRAPDPGGENYFMGMLGSNPVANLPAAAASIASSPEGVDHACGVAGYSW